MTPRPKNEQKHIQHTHTPQLRPATHFPAGVCHSTRAAVATLPSQVRKNLESEFGGINANINAGRSDTTAGLELLNSNVSAGRADNDRNFDSVIDNQRIAEELQHTTALAATRARFGHAQRMDATIVRVGEDLRASLGQAFPPSSPCCTPPHTHQHIATHSTTHNT